jgi:soluble lytic murein transglycosylase-like protein
MAFLGSALHAAPLAVATLVAGVLTAGPAEARGTPWPGHPDRRLVSHVVRPGETATGLAVRYHAWTRELVALNHLGPHATLRAGERVRVPVVVSAARRDRADGAPSSPAAEAAPATPAESAAGTRDDVRRLLGRTAHRLGVPARLAQAVAWQESGWRQRVRSPAGAVGVMQVLPSTGLWMSLYAHRPLDLRDTHDNVTAGVTLLRVLLDETGRTRSAVAAYYQGLGALRRHGMYPETRRYVASVQAIRERLPWSRP